MLTQIILRTAGYIALFALTFATLAAGTLSFYFFTQDMPTAALLASTVTGALSVYVNIIR
jgi:hypothetical protein